jgi:hypothetical protein
MSPDQISQLAKTFSTACKDAAKKSKAQTYMVSIALSAVTVLFSLGKGSTWLKT